MEASIHRRYRSIWCISSVKNPGQEEEEEEALHESVWSGAFSARLKFEGVAQSVFSTEFSSRRVVCRSPKPGEMFTDQYTHERDNVSLLSVLENEVFGEWVAANTWRQMTGRRSHSIFLFRQHEGLPTLPAAAFEPRASSSHTRQPINYEHAIRRRVSKQVCQTLLQHIL